MVRWSNRIIFSRSTGTQSEYPEICTVDTPITGWVANLGQQFQQKQKVLLKEFLLLRMKVLKGGFNLNWFEFKEI